MTPAPPPHDPNAADAVGLCTHCGYALQGLKIGGTCPECGVIIRVQRRVLLREANLEYLQYAATGSWMLAASGAVMGVGFLWTLIVTASTPPTLHVPESLTGAALIAWVLLSSGWLIIFTRNMPAVAYAPPYLTWPIRLFSVIQMICAAGVTLGAASMTASDPSSAPVLLLAICGYIGVPSSIAVAIIGCPKLRTLSRGCQTDPVGVKLIVFACFVVLTVGIVLVQGPVWGALAAATVSTAVWTWLTSAVALGIHRERLAQSMEHPS